MAAAVTSLWRRISDLMAEVFGQNRWQCPGVLEEIFRTAMSSGLVVVARLKVTVI